MSNTPDDLSEKKRVFLETHPCSAMTQSQKNLNKVARDLFVWNLIQNISIPLRLLYKDSWHLERYSQWVVFQKYVVSFIWGHQIKPHTYINMCLLESRGLRCQKQTKNTFLAHSSLEWISTSSDLAKVCRMNFYWPCRLLRFQWKLIQSQLLFLL